MMNENNMENLEGIIVEELDEEDLELVAGGSKVIAMTDTGVYSGPGTHYRRIGTMTVGEPFKSKHKKARDSDGNKWYMINYNGQTGWVRAKYCVKDRS